MRWIKLKPIIQSEVSQKEKHQCIITMQGDPTSPFWRRSTLGFLWKEWCWSWNSSTLATSCKELTHWKTLWCWEGLGAGGEGVNRGWDGWMASLIQGMWVWVNSRSWWWTGRPGMLQFMGLQRVGHDWVTELNWILHCVYVPQLSYPFICWWTSRLLPQFLPASESFPISQLFAWGGQSTGASALASFLPGKSQGWSPSEWTGWISW